MQKIVLGHSGGRKIVLDLDVLLRTRGLIQGNSGCGKSETLQYLAEQFDGKVQTIIIDLEDEFSILRKKHNYILVGKGGETPADCRSAAVLAHKLLELRASAVCNLYEMKAHDRHRWVRLFLESLIDAPKHLWHPVVIIIDEIHIFCPEKGAGESEASDAVIDLATRGRKRGFCLLGATQRLGKFRKDAAAELLNIIVGMTFIDVDRKRAAEALGIPKSEERKFFDDIKVMDSGKFWVLGRAISKDRVLVNVNRIGTPRAKAGSKTHASEPPPTPEKIKSLLPKLADLPKVADEKAKTEAELKAEVRRLSSELAQAKRGQPAAMAVRKVGSPAAAPLVKTVEVPAIKDAQIVKLERIAARVSSEVTALSQAADLIRQSAKKGQGAPLKQYSFTGANVEKMVSTVDFRRGHRNGIERAGEAPKSDASQDGAPLEKAERRILTVLAQHPDGCSIGKIALLSLYRISGGFKNSLSSLRTKGYIVGGNGETMKITDAGGDALGNGWEPIPTGPALVNFWTSHPSFGICEQKIMRALFSGHRDGMTMDRIALESGYAVSGGFKNSLSALRTAGVLVGKNTDQMRLCEDLLEAAVSG